MRAALAEDRTRLLAAARDLGLERGEIATAMQEKELRMRIGDGRRVEVPPMGHAVTIRPAFTPAPGLMLHWDDGRFGDVDLDTLDVPFASD